MAVSLRRAGWAVILVLPWLAHAGDVSVAVAANFTDTAQELAAAFEKTTGHHCVLSFGSSGKLYAQIANGAPFQVFLSADVSRARMAEEAGLAVMHTRFTYARGKLVLWSAKLQLFQDGEAYLVKSGFQRLAMANPQTAPYGLAAQQTLQHLMLWNTLQPKLVRGDSIAQVFQFVATGNVEAAFVAHSQVIAWRGEPGSVWEVPAGYHEPIDQQAVLLYNGRDNAAAVAFLEFLKSPAAREMITAHGYAAP